MCTHGYPGLPVWVFKWAPMCSQDYKNSNDNHNYSNITNSNHNSNTTKTKVCATMQFHP